jgi:apolipoprotein N-acyltransferase
MGNTAPVRGGGVRARAPKPVPRLAVWAATLRRTFLRLSALRGWRADVAALLFGALAAAALPPVHAIPVLLICVPALLALIDGAPSGFAAFRRGFWFGWGNFVFGLYWITEAILIEAARYWWLVPLAVPALSALLALFVAVPCGLCRAATAGWRRAALLAGLWVLADLARQFIGTGFPWDPWGSVWTMPAAWVGVHGMTLATLLLAATPALGWRFVAGGAAVLVAWAGYGVYRLDLPGPAPQNVQVVLVQGNVPQGDKWDRSAARTVFDRYLALTHKGVVEAMAAAPGSTIAVVWPESASPYLLGQDPAAREAIWQAAQPALAAIVGSVRFDATRHPLNSMFALDGPDSIAGIYDKWHLVPFGEFAPSWVPFAVQMVPGVGFAFGSGPETIHVSSLPPFGGLICYEAIYPAQLVDEADRPTWLVNITNDAWFGNSSGPRQHLMAARLRAVEEGLPLVRAANTGITGAFDAHGRALGRLERGVAAEMVVSLPGALPPTPFSRHGLVIPALLALATCAAALRLVGKRGVAPLH